MIMINITILLLSMATMVARELELKQKMVNDIEDIDCYKQIHSNLNFIVR